jgi:microcystin-dependent protein
MIGDIIFYKGPLGMCIHPDTMIKCNGRLLSIVDYPDLFALIGTRYGGDGITTFAICDMRNTDAEGNYHIVVL